MQETFSGWLWKFAFGAAFLLLLLAVLYTLFHLATTFSGGITL